MFSGHVCQAPKPARLRIEGNMLRQIPGCVDLVDELWPQLTAEVAAFLCPKPWTENCV